MYNIEFYNFGEKIKKIRKLKNMTTKELASLIGKSEFTVYKYESNEIMPDHITVLEICNALEISHDELMGLERIEEAKETAYNPFEVESLYLYYLGFNRLAEFRIDIKPENGFQKVYFNVIDKDSKEYRIFYIGSIEANQEIAFINMKNYYTVNKRFEKVSIMVNMNYAKDDKNMGVIFATKQDTSIPIIKKCIFSKSQIITEVEKEQIIERLKITEKELENIKNNNMWLVDYPNNTGFAGV